MRFTREFRETQYHATQQPVRAKQIRLENRHGNKKILGIELQFERSEKTAEGGKTEEK